MLRNIIKEIAYASQIWLKIPNENIDRLILDVARTISDDISQSDIDRSNRIEKSGKRPVRDIIVKFNSYRAFETLMNNRSNLNTSELPGVYVNEDLSQACSKVLFEARRSVKANRLLGA